MMVNEEIIYDVSEVFKQLMGFGKVCMFKYLWQVLFMLQLNVVVVIQVEIEVVCSGKKVYIVVKMNLLFELEVINVFYEVL